MIKLDNKKQYYLIETTDDIQFCLDEVLTSDVVYVSFDTETTGLNVRKDKVIGYSFSTEVGQGYYFPMYLYNKELDVVYKTDLHQHYKLILNKLLTFKLIMHNGAFDTKIVFNNLESDLLSSLHADTQLMRHTLQEDGPFGLKDIAVELQKEIGINHTEVANQEQLELEQNVKANGGSWTKANKEMYKADLNILAKYACADTDLTLRLFLYFEEKLKQENLHNFFYIDEVMPLYTHITIPMEFEGLYLDMDKLTNSNIAINEEIEKAKVLVSKAIIESEVGQEFVRRRLAEYVPSIKGSFAQEAVEYFKLDLPKTSAGKYSITTKNISGLKDVPQFFLTADPTTLEQEDLEAIQMSLLKKDEPSIINIGSKQQLCELVFDIMGMTPISKTEKGAPQFNESFLETIDLPWAAELRVYNKLVKIQGSYYQRYLDQNEDGIFYPTFKQFATTSGRYGSDLQQLSKPLEGEDAENEDPRIVRFTNTLRELFIPKPGHVFIDDDYESLEPRTFADDASDAALIEIFDKGEDFYSKVAIQAQKLEGMSALKNDPNFLKKLKPSLRQNAKAYSLGIRYGMRSGKLAKTLNISQEDADEIINGYFQAFPGLKAKMDQYITEAKTKGRVTSKYGRVRHLPMVKAIYDKYGDDITDYSKLSKLSKKFYKPYNELKELRGTYNNLLNNALNFPIQSAAASIVNRAMLAMTYEFRKRGLEAWVTLQLHDQIVVSCRDNVVEEVKNIVQHAMENTNKLAMQLVAKPEVAKNLRDGH